jgi:hypothetical protein
VEKYGRAGHITDDNMALAHCIWIRKAKNTPSVYVILVGFPLQHRSHERASLLRFTYIACPVINQMCVYCAVRALS